MLDQSDNLNYSFSCYFRSAFVPRNSSFKSWLYVFSKFDIIIYRQSDNWNIKFCIIYLKCCYHFLLSWISIWINFSKCFLYFRYYTRFCSFQVSFISQLMANQEISKHFSNMLMEQQLLCQIYYYCLLCFLLFLSLLKRFTCCYFIIFPVIVIISFCIIIYFIFIIIPQTF